MAVQTQGLRQVQKQTQSLVLAPQLRQSLKILQVPTLELRSVILEELQTNPLLEEIGSNDESLDSTEVEPSPDEVHEQEADDFPDEVENPSEKESKEEIDFDIFCTRSDAASTVSATALTTTLTLHPAPSEDGGCES